MGGQERGGRSLAERLAPFGRYVVNRRRRSGRRARLYVGRGTSWGNPFAMVGRSAEERLRVVQAFADHLRAMPAAQRTALLVPIYRVLVHGGALECWCSPSLCHAQVLAAWALSDKRVEQAASQAA